VSATGHKSYRYGYQRARNRSDKRRQSEIDRHAQILQYGTDYRDDDPEASGEFRRTTKHYEARLFMNRSQRQAFDRDDWNPPSQILCPDLKHSDSHEWKHSNRTASALAS
jgi:hypothetical protein